jgi:hypothetical protein
VSLFDFLNYFKSNIEVIKVELINSAFFYDSHRYDQTYHSVAECAIEFIVRKRPDIEIARKGRYP